MLPNTALLFRSLNRTACVIVSSRCRKGSATTPSYPRTTINDLRFFGIKATEKYNKKKKPQKKIYQGKPKNKAITRKYQKRDKTRPKNHGSLSKAAEAQEKMIEPADSIGGIIPFITATGSEHVYVAGCAVEEKGMDPSTIFHNVRSRPRSFVESNFFWKEEKEFKTSMKEHNYAIPEIALLGKSNVGKSSLANSLMNNKQLAITSKTPGRTRLPFYFGMYPPNIPETQATKRTSLHPSAADAYIVDLPGYGFAKVSDDASSNWQKATQDFLLARHEKGTLQRLFLLIDSRRGIAEFDRAIMSWFDEAQIPYSIVFTKADAVSKPEMVRVANEVGMRYHAQLFANTDEDDGHRLAKGCMSPVIHFTSASKGFGISELLISMEADFLQYKINQSGDDRFTITTEEGDEVHVDRSPPTDDEEQNEQSHGSPYADEADDDGHEPSCPDEHRGSGDFSSEEEDEYEGYEGFADEDNYDIDNEDDDKHHYGGKSHS